MPTRQPSNAAAAAAMATGEIVAAWISNKGNHVEARAIPRIVAEVRAALDAADPPPAVHRDGLVLCLECNRTMVSLALHLKVAHGLAADRYRARWGLRPGQALEAPQLSHARAQAAREQGLGKHHRAGKP